VILIWRLGQMYCIYGSDIAGLYCNIFILSESRAKEIFSFIHDIKFTYHKLGYFDPSLTFTQMKTKLSQQQVNICVDDLFVYTEKLLCGKKEPREDKKELNDFLSKIKEIDASKLSRETETFLTLQNTYWYTWRAK